MRLFPPTWQCSGKEPARDTVEDLAALTRQEHLVNVWNISTTSIIIQQKTAMVRGYSNIANSYILLPLKTFNLGGGMAIERSPHPLPFPFILSQFTSGK